MESEHPTLHRPALNRIAKSEESKETPSRLMDEKICDECGTEATSEAVFAPAGLNNPFWH